MKMKRMNNMLVYKLRKNRIKKMKECKKRTWKLVKMKRTLMKK